MMVRAIGVALAIVGFAGFLAPLWIGLFFTDPDHIEFPLGDIADVAVDPEGSIYFAIPHLGRIQKYTSNGDFVRGISVDASGGAFCLDADGTGLNILIARRDAADRINFEGEYLSRGAQIGDEAYSANCYLDRKIESIKRGLNEVSVLKTGDLQPTIIKRQHWHYLALTPLSSWLMGAVGLALIPEWRRPILRALRPAKTSNTANRPTGVLKIFDVILNIIWTLFVLAFTAIGFSILGLGFSSADPETRIGIAALMVLWLIFPGYSVYKIWSTASDEVVIAPGLSFPVGPAGAVAWKAFGILILVAFIFSVFYFGEKWAKASGYYDEEKEIASGGL